MCIYYIYIFIYLSIDIYIYIHSLQFTSYFFCFLGVLCLKGLIFSAVLRMKLLRSRRVSTWMDQIAWQTVGKGAPKKILPTSYTVEFIWGSWSIMKNMVFFLSEVDSHLWFRVLCSVDMFFFKSPNLWERGDPIHATFHSKPGTGSKCGLGTTGTNKIQRVSSWWVVCGESGKHPTEYPTEYWLDFLFF